MRCGKLERGERSYFDHVEKAKWTHVWSMLMALSDDGNHRNVSDYLPSTYASPA